MLMTCGFFITVLLFQNAICWKLDFLGIDEDKVKFSRIAVYLGHRAFVSIPRVHDEQRVTLVELPWPEYSLSSSYNTKPFPHLESQVSLLILINPIWIGNYMYLELFSVKRV